MLMIRKVVIGDAERGLVYRNRCFERVLGPGVHRLRCSTSPSRSTPAAMSMPSSLAWASA